MKIFGYTVFVGHCLATKGFICSYQRCVGDQLMMKGSHGPRKFNSCMTYFSMSVCSIVDLYLGVRPWILMGVALGKIQH